MTRTNPSQAQVINQKIPYRQKLTFSEMEERRTEGLCFNCDEKFIVAHVCMRKRQLFSIELEESTEEEIGEGDCIIDPAQILSMIGQGLATDSEGLIMPHVSVHAMNGLYDFKTMRVTTSLKGKAI